jgi:hypothetical protein
VSDSVNHPRPRPIEQAQRRKEPAALSSLTRTESDSACGPDPANETVQQRFWYVPTEGLKMTEAGTAGVPQAGQALPDDSYMASSEGLSVVHMVAERVRRSPAALAVVDPVGGQLTYAQLWSDSALVAGGLAGFLGAGPGRVGIYMRRSCVLISVIVGILRAGGSTSMVSRRNDCRSEQ